LYCRRLPRPMRNRFFYLRLLRASLVAGALYDLAFAGALVLEPELPARLLGVPLPGEPFYLWILAVLITMVAALYLFAAEDPRRYSAVVLVAALGRCAAAVAFGTAALGDPALVGLWTAAAIELAFGLAHGWLWGRVR
jgi:hypothetical protein